MNHSILQLCTSPDLGGLELYMCRTTKWLKEAGISCFAAVRRSSAISEYLKDYSIEQFQMENIFYSLPYMRAKKLAAFIDKNAIDLIHVHWARDLMLAILVKRLSVRNIRVVYTRQMEIPGSKHDFYHRYIYKNLDLMLVVTDRLKYQAIERVPIDKARIIRLYHGAANAPVSSAKVCTSFRKEIGFRNEDFLVGLVGRLEPKKGQHLIIEAINLLNKEDITIRVVLIGRPMFDNYYKELQDMVSAYGLEKNIVFYGFYPNTPGLMNCFDTVVLTTECETFGLVLIEAMKAGTAVVGTNACGVREILDNNETGLMFTSGDASSLAVCLKKLYLDPAFRSKIANAGKRKVNSTFSESAHFSSLKQHFTSTINSPAHGTE